MTTKTTTTTTTTGTYINLAVRDLQKSVAFFQSLGFAFDARFTDANAACLVLNDTTGAMLLTHDYFQGFAPQPVSDARKTTEVLIALSLADRRQVDDLVKRAVAAGATTYNERKDHGFMYQQGFQDLDGHIWEVFHMDMAAFEAMRKGG